MNGCTHISAYNFDPNATVWDHSCLYLLKVSVPNVLTSEPETFCLLFQDVQNYEDKSFTLSRSVKGDAWVFFHDYIPDFYFHTRESLFNTKNSRELYKHHEGPVGVYHEEEPKSFFIDIVFNAGTDILLETVQWISSWMNDRADISSRDSEWQTLTHISIWNSQQHTGRVALQDVFAKLQYETSRIKSGEWSFNDFRNVVAQRGSQFLQDLFNDYMVDNSLIETKPWYDADLMQDKYMIVRFEFDNSVGKLLTLHNTSITAQVTNR